MSVDKPAEDDEAESTLARTERTFPSPDRPRATDAERGLFADAFETLLRRSGDYVLVLDPTYAILAAGDRFRNTITTSCDPIGRSFLESLDSGSRTKAKSFLDRLADRHCTVELNHRTLSGAIRLANYDFCRRETPAGAYIIAVGRDQEDPLKLVEQMVGLNAQVEQARGELARQALTDPLTEVSNRRGLFQQLDSLWSTAARQGDLTWVMMADLDHFKRINDNYGHNAGDQALKATSKAFRAAVRGGDIVSRYGGEEFVMAGACRDMPEVRVIADRLLRTIRELRLELPDRVVRLSVSLGVALVQPGPFCQPWVAVQAADHAVYRAKAEGRDRCEFEPEVLGRLEEARAGRGPATVSVDELF